MIDEKKNVRITSNLFNKVNHKVETCWVNLFLNFSIQSKHIYLTNGIVYKTMAVKNERMNLKDKTFVSLNLIVYEIKRKIYAQK